MKPLTLLWYSLIVAGDVLILYILMSMASALITSWGKVWIKLYFAEKELFLKRLGTTQLPYDVHSRMD